MNPIVIRSLGALAPPRPKTEAGTMAGTAKAAPRTVVVWCRNRRRVTLNAEFISSFCATARTADYGLDSRLSSDCTAETLLSVGRCNFSCLGPVSGQISHQ